MDCVCTIEVERAPDGRYCIRWDDAFTNEPVTVFAGQDPDAPDAGAPAVTGARGRAEIAGLDAGRRQYFLLRTEGGAAISVAQRNVPLERGINFRDLGGYAAADGRRVRWGRLFRSGHMSNLTPGDRDAVASLGIRTVCDMRLPDEIANEQALLPNGPAVEALAVPPGIRDPLFFHKLFERADGPQDIVDAMHRLIRSLVLESTAQYRRLFEILLAGQAGPLLINCSAGKERTGVGAALLLMALGVPRETIDYDFMLSLKYFPAESELDRVLTKYQVRRRPGDRDLVMPLLETRATYIEAAFGALEQVYGSGDDFLRDAYGLGPGDLSRLRDRYLA